METIFSLQGMFYKTEQGYDLYLPWCSPIITWGWHPFPDFLFNGENQYSFQKNHLHFFTYYECLTCGIMPDSELLFKTQEIQWKECATTWLQEIVKECVNWGILHVAILPAGVAGDTRCSSSVNRCVSAYTEFDTGGHGKHLSNWRHWLPSIQGKRNNCVLPWSCNRDITFGVHFQNFYALNRLPHKGVVSSSYFTFHLFSLPPSSVPLLRALPAEDGASLFWSF